jgi:hypothetical protein
VFPKVPQVPPPAPVSPIPPAPPADCAKAGAEMASRATTEADAKSRRCLPKPTRANTAQKRPAALGSNRHHFARGQRIQVVHAAALRQVRDAHVRSRAQSAALSARLLGVEKALRKKPGSFRRRR